MPRIASVAPVTTRIALAEGDWIEVKKYLTAGEKKRLEGAGVSAMRQSNTSGSDLRAKQSFELDFERLSLGRIEAYVVAWSFLDLDSKPLPVTPETIASLIPEIAEEIDRALDVHVKEMEQAKKQPALALASATS